MSRVRLGGPEAMTWATVSPGGNASGTLPSPVRWAGRHRPGCEGTGIESWPAMFSMTKVRCPARTARWTEPWASR